MINYKLCDVIEKKSEALIRINFMFGTNPKFNKVASAVTILNEFCMC